jgi:hypothetical protein
MHVVCAVRTCVHLVRNKLACNIRSCNKVHTSRGKVFLFLLSLLMCSLFGLTYKRFLEVVVFLFMARVDASIQKCLAYLHMMVSSVEISLSARNVKTTHLNYLFLFYKFYKYLYELFVQTIRSKQNYLKI